MNQKNTENIIPNVNSKEKEERNVPDLRFGFHCNWNMHKLKEFTHRITTKNKRNESNLILTISAENGLVNQEKFFNRKVASDNLSGYYLLKKGDFAYNKSYSNNYPWGAIKRLDNYDKGVVSALYICFSSNDDIDSDYLKHYFESNKWNHEVSDIAVEGARNHGLLNISINDFFNTNHYLPGLTEQKKIACFLNLIEARLDTQKKIIEEIHLLKKTICDTYRKLNCSKFKIKDLGKIGRGRVISSSEISKQKNPQYPVYSSQTMNDGIMGYLDDYDFEGEYITWTTDGANAGTVFYHNERFNCTNVCGTIKITNKIIDPFYMSLILQYESKKYVSLNLANPKLMNNTMASIEIKVPPMTYQLEITKIVKSINKKLDNEVKILKLYQKQKDYLLEHMFI